MNVKKTEEIATGTAIGRGENLVVPEGAEEITGSLTGAMMIGESAPALEAVLVPGVALLLPVDAAVVRGPDLAQDLAPGAVLGAVLASMLIHSRVHLVDP